MSRDDTDNRTIDSKQIKAILSEICDDRWMWNDVDHNYFAIFQSGWHVYIGFEYATSGTMPWVGRKWEDDFLLIILNYDHDCCRHFMEKLTAPIQDPSCFEQIRERALQYFEWFSED